MIHSFLVIFNLHNTTGYVQVDNVDRNLDDAKGSVNVFFFVFFASRTFKSSGQ